MNNKEFSMSSIARPRLLLIAEQEHFGSAVASELNRYGFESAVIDTPVDFNQAVNELKRLDYSVVIVTNTSVSPRDIPDLVSKIRKVFPSIGIIVMSGWAELEFAMECKKSGVDDFIPMPYETNEVVASLKKIIADRRG